MTIPKARPEVIEITNPFLDPERKIAQGQSEEDIIANWEGFQKDRDRLSGPSLEEGVEELSAEPSTGNPLEKRTWILPPRQKYVLPNDDSGLMRYLEKELNE